MGKGGRMTPSVPGHLRRPHAGAISMPAVTGNERRSVESPPAHRLVASNSRTDALGPLFLPVYVELAAIRFDAMSCYV